MSRFSLIGSYSFSTFTLSLMALSAGAFCGFAQIAYAHDGKEEIRTPAVTTGAADPVEMIESHHGCGCHNSGPVPISVMGEHLHARGEFMVGYRFMNQAMKDHAGHALERADEHSDHNDTGHNDSEGDSEHGDHHEEHAMRSGVAQPESSVGFPRHGGEEHAPMTPASTHRHEMSMQMHMLDVMYGVTDEFTAMVMIPFHQMEMNHYIPGMEHTTRSEGLGDVALSALFRAGRWGKQELLLNPGLTLPTGDIDDRDSYHGIQRKHPYHMKLGSGTVDLTPAATYRLYGEGWNVGAQLGGVLRLGENDQDYALGNRIRMLSWVGTDLGNGFGSTVRIGGEAWRDVRGAEKNQSISSPFFDPDQQAGYLVDAGIGLSYAGSGSLAGQRIGVEFSVPLAQETDDGVHEVDWTLSAGWIVTF